MTFLLENLWIWIGLAIVLAGFGGSNYMGTQNRKTLTICGVAAVLVLLLGLILVYGIDTDRKAISRMLDQLTKAIEEDNLDKVKTFIAPDALSTRSLAELNMARVRLTSAKVRNLTVETNHMTSPPTARVKFVGVVHYKFKSGSFGGLPGIGDNQGVQRVQFDVELIKTNKSWHVTDDCKFTPSAT